MFTKYWKKIIHYFHTYINKNSATFISARFLKYFEKDYNYHYTGVKNGFYALYKSNNFHTDEILKLIEMIKSSTK